MKKISFCITCKNRLYQISKTLLTNLEDNQDHKDLIEFVLLDFQSDDGLQDWVLSNFSQALEEGYLKYYYVNQHFSWHAPIAKNTSHLLGRGQFLVNLDCDNYTGYRGGEYVLNQFDSYGEKLLLHQFTGDYLDGSYGRIGMHRKYFHLIGGYDEAFEPMGHEDMDLVNRLCELGLYYKRFYNNAYNKAIRNTKEESIQYSNSKLSWREMELKNAKLSKEKLFGGRIIANRGMYGIRENIFTYRHGKVVGMDVATSALV